MYALGEEVFTQELYPNLYSIWSEAEVVELFGSDSDTCFVCEASDKTFMGFVLGTEIEVGLALFCYTTPWVCRLLIFLGGTRSIIAPQDVTPTGCDWNRLVPADAHVLFPPYLLAAAIEKGEQLALWLPALARCLSQGARAGRGSPAFERVPGHNGGEWMSLAALR